jgi:hypothetical protein
MVLGRIRVDVPQADPAEVERLVQQAYPAWFTRRSETLFALELDDGPFTVSVAGAGHPVELDVARVPPPQLARPWRLALDLAQQWRGTLQLFALSGASVLGPCSAAVAKQARSDWPYLWRPGDVRRAVEDTFAARDRQRALAALMQLGGEWRLQLAVVKLAGGDLVQLDRFVAMAGGDYRDVLLEAGI